MKVESEHRAKLEQLNSMQEEQRYTAQFYCSIVLLLITAFSPFVFMNNR